MRILNQYPDLIAEKDPFPTKKTSTANVAGEKLVEVERENFEGKTGPVKKVKITNTQGAYTEFEIFTLDNQAVIYWNSGV